MGFELSERWAAGPLTVELEGEAADVPEVRVNNRPVVASATDSGWVLDVPAEVVAAMGEGRLVVTLAQPAGEPLVLTGVWSRAVLRVPAVGRFLYQSARFRDWWVWWL